MIETSVIQELSRNILRTLSNIYLWYENNTKVVPLPLLLNGIFIPCYVEIIFTCYHIAILFLVVLVFSSYKLIYKFTNVFIDEPINVVMLMTLIINQITLY